MRPLIVLPVLIAVIACGSSKLEKATAEKLIRPDYPAVLLVKVPLATDIVPKDSDKDRTFQRINEALVKEGWFEVKKEERDGKVRYMYQMTPKAPKSVKPGLKNFEAPAAMVDFVGAVKMEPMDSRDKGRSFKVTYLVKVTKPSPLWPVYEMTHTGATLNQPMERHAQIDRSGSNWGLIRTDEPARIKE